MFEERVIIYFDPFYFKNGNTAKPKYFVVLKNIENKNILASLPTRKDSVPENKVIEKGCVELPSINLNCFVIPKNTEVTECGKFFEFKTHIYGHQIDDYEVHLLKEIYLIENADYSIWGKMKEDIFISLIECFKNSKSVKKKYQKLLNF